ncbi:MAG: hypothetical protein WCH30_04165 [Chlorobiaceae bacterium]
MLLRFEKQIIITTGLLQRLRTCFMVFFFVIISGVNMAAAQQSPSRVTHSSVIKNTHGTLIASDTPVEGAKLVTVGIYGINIYNMDMRSNTYHMTAYLWMRWTGDFDPVESLDFVNGVEDWGLVKKVILKEPELLSNGEKYQVIRIDGVFFQPFNLKNYPLDKQELSLYMENSSDTYDKIFYVPDTISSGYDAGLIVPGWRVNGFTSKSFIHDYGTDFGETGVAKASKYSVVKFAFHLDREVNVFLLKLFIPLLIVLMTNWFSLILKPTYIEVRTTMPATALLTLVFLQKSAMDAIPECPSLVLMDKIYLLAYLCIVLTLLQIIWVNVYMDRESPASIQRMIKVDRVSFIVQISLFVVVFVGLMLEIIYS